MAAPGYDVSFDTWARAGKGVDGAADTLASAVDTLCLELAGAGAPWGQDDIGRAFFNGSDEAPGFGAVRDTVLSGLADAVNLLRATGDTLSINGRNYRLAEDASSIGGAIPDGADKGALARKDPYRLPRVSETLARSDPPPDVVTQIIWFVKSMVGGVQWPDGDMGGLGRVKNAFTTAATAVREAAQELEGHARTVTANNTGAAVDEFATFAAALHGGGEEQGLLWLAGKCQQLADSTDFLMRQEDAARLQFELSCGFLVLTWVLAWSISWITGGGSVAAAEAVTEVEGLALRTFLRTVAKAVGAGMWFAGGMDALGQYARIHEGVQEGFDGQEFAHALEEGGIAGAVMGGAGAAVAAGGTRLTAALADRMGSSGLARAGFAGVTGTAGNIAAQGLVEHKVDLGQAAAFGFGMAGLGYAGEVGRHILGQTAAPAKGTTSAVGDIPNDRDFPHYSDKGVGYGLEGHVIDNDAGRPGDPAPVESAAETGTGPSDIVESSSHEPVPARGDAADGGAGTIGDTATTMAGHQGPADFGGRPSAGTHSDVTDAGQNPIGDIVNRPADSGVEPRAGHGSDLVIVQRDGTTVAGGPGTHPPADGSGAPGAAGPGHVSRTGLADATDGAQAAPYAGQSPTRPHAERVGPAPGDITGASPHDVVIAGMPLDRAGRSFGMPRPDEAQHTSTWPVEPLRSPASRADRAPSLVPGFDPGRTGSGPREAHRLRSADLNPDTRPPLMPAHSENALTALRGEHAYTLTEGEALHASQWAHLRDDATATPVGRERHPFEDASKVEVRRLGVATPDGGERAVTELTVTIRYHADPAMTPEKVLRARSNVLDAVDVHFNHRHRLVDQSQLHVRVEFERAESAAGTVLLRPGDGTGEGERPDMLTWYADMDPVVIAHEVGHHLDLHDEYADPARPGAETLTAPGVTREPSLMGDGLRSWADGTLIVDHHGNPVPSIAGLRDRHLVAMQRLADRAAPGVPDVRGDAGPVVPAEHAPRESHPLDLPDHVRDLIDRVDEDGRPVFPAEGRDALEQAVALDRMHALFGDETRTAAPAHLRYTEALTDAAHRLYEAAPEYSFRESDLRGLRHLADVAGASPEGALPSAGLLHEAASQTLGRSPAPREVEALTRLAEHLNDQMDGRRPLERPSDALHRSAADLLWTTRGSETTREAIDLLAEDRPGGRDHPGEHPVPRMGSYEREKRRKIDARNAAIRDFETRNGRLTPQEKQELRERIDDELSPSIDNQHRPSHRRETLREIFGRAKRDADGNILSATTGKPIKPGEIHKGHIDGNEHHKLVRDANQLGINKSMFDTAMQNADLYRLERGPGKDGNSSHRHEDKSNNPSELFKDAEILPDGSMLLRGVRILRDGSAVNAKTGKPIRKGDVVHAWETPTKAVRGQAQRAAKKVVEQQNKAVQEQQNWLTDTQQKSNLSGKEKKALEAQQKANEMRSKADGAFFFKKSSQDEADKAQQKADEAYKKANRRRKF